MVQPKRCDCTQWCYLIADVLACNKLTVTEHYAEFIRIAEYIMFFALAVHNTLAFTYFHN